LAEDNRVLFAGNILFSSPTAFRNKRKLQELFNKLRTKQKRRHNIVAVYVSVSFGRQKLLAW
jgi:hypothetical protein